MKFFKKYPEASLATIAIVFLAIILGSFSWGVGAVFTAVDGAVNFAGANQGAANFNLTAASQLDFRGLYVTPSATSSPQ